MRKNDHSRSPELSDLIWPWMFLDDLDTWWVIYSVFISADFESGLRFVVNNDAEAQDSYKVRIMTAEMSHGNGQRHPWPCVTFPRRQLHMSLLSINTNYTPCNVKTYSRRQWNSPKHDRSQHLPISTEHDLIYDVITSWPDISGR